MTLDEALRAAGCNLVELEGWQVTSYRGRTPSHAGVLLHHDVSPATRNELRLAEQYQDGISRPDGYLPGPIYNVAVGDRTTYLIAAGYSNNAGAGVYGVRRGTQRDRAPEGLATKPYTVGLPRNGNPYYFGVTILNDGTSEPVPDSQLEELLRALEGIHRWKGWSWRRLVEHREFTSRKIDPSMLPGDTGRVLRGMLSDRLDGTGTEEDFLSALSDDEQRELYEAVLLARDAVAPEDFRVSPTEPHNVAFASLQANGTIQTVLGSQTGRDAFAGDIADAVVAALPDGAVDVDAVAAAIVAQLGTLTGTWTVSDT